MAGLLFLKKQNKTKTNVLRLYLNESRESFFRRGTSLHAEAPKTERLNNNTAPFVSASPHTRARRSHGKQMRPSDVHDYIVMNQLQHRFLDLSCCSQSPHPHTLLSFPAISLLLFFFFPFFRKTNKLLFLYQFISFQLSFMYFFPISFFLSLSPLPPLPFAY